MTKVTSDDDSDGISEIGNFAYWISWAITIIAGLLVLFFAWLQLRTVEVLSLLSQTKPELLLKFTLILYYVCWVFGSKFDLKLQQSALVRDPDRGRVPVGAIVLLAAFGLSTLILVWASTNELRFALALDLFWIIGSMGYPYIRYVITPMINESARLLSLRVDHYRLEKLLIMVRYQCGRWQLYRMGLSLVLLILINLVTLSPTTRHFVAKTAASLSAQLSADTVYQILPSLSFLVFVLITEAWIWFNRLRVYVALELLADLRRRYIFQPKAAET